MRRAVSRGGNGCRGPPRRRAAGAGGLRRAPGHPARRKARRARGGGCGDDSFDYFRSWLIMQGKDTFERVLREPERLPQWYPPGKLDFADGFGSLAMTAFEENYPDRNFDAEYDGPYGPGELKGEMWRTDEELQAMYPELWDRYLGEYD